MSDHQTPRDYIRQLRTICNAAIKRGEQIDFYDGLAISRPTGEQAVYWLLRALRETQARNAELKEALMLLRSSVTTAVAYADCVADVQAIVDSVLEEQAT